MSYRPDGQRLIFAGDDKTLREWDADTGECIRIFNGHFDNVNSVSYRPDGQRIISTSGNLIEWDADTGARIKNQIKTGENITLVNYRPDGRRIIIVSENEYMKEWHVATGELTLNYISVN